MPRMSSQWSVVSCIVVLVVGALSMLAAPVEAQSPKSGTAPTPEAQQALAPTGKLRVGLYLGGPSSVIRESTSGEMKGVGFDLGRELARRMGVPFEPVVFPSIGALLDSAHHMVRLLKTDVVTAADELFLLLDGGTHDSHLDAQARTIEQPQRLRRIERPRIRSFRDETELHSPACGCSRSKCRAVKRNERVQQRVMRHASPETGGDGRAAEWDFPCG